MPVYSSLAVSCELNPATPTVRHDTYPRVVSRPRNEQVREAGKNAIRQRKPFARLWGLSLTATARHCSRLVLFVLLLSLCATVFPVSSRANPGPGDSRSLEVTGLEFEGLEKTRETLARRAAGIEVGHTVTPAQLAGLESRLERSRLFRKAEVRVLAGAERGEVQLVIRVEESRPHFRFGLGHQDLDGWFLEPVEFNLDNLTGRGEHFDLSWRIGFRTNGLHLNWRLPSPESHRTYVGWGWHGVSHDRLYFAESTEIAHEVRRQSFDVNGSVDLGRGFYWEGSVAYERTAVDSSARVYVDSPSGAESGTEIRYAQLPETIQASVDTTMGVRVRSAWIFDGRRGQELAREGTWGRVVYEALSSERRPIHRGELDLRAYKAPFPGWQLAARLHVEAVSKNSPFHERIYLGGLYTVRGYATHVFSPPEGHRRRVVVSAEIRRVWVGTAEAPRVAGLAFVDFGRAWNSSATNPTHAAAAGFGWRVGVPWLGYLGLDVGIPLDDSIVDESFHLSTSLGWTF